MCISAFFSEHVFSMPQDRSLTHLLQTFSDFEWHTQPRQSPRTRGCMAVCDHRAKLCDQSLDTGPFCTRRNCYTLNVL